MAISSKKVYVVSEINEEVSDLAYRKMEGFHENRS
jgi:hypothetical protein